MLILTRRIGEKIVIGENAEIEISVLRIKGNQVIVGIEAERTIPVHRFEIYQRIQAEKTEYAQQAVGQ